MDMMDERGDNADVPSPENSGKRQRKLENKQSPESEKESTSSKRSKREEDVAVEEAAINKDDGSTAKAGDGEQIDASETCGMDEECKAKGSSVPGIADALSPVVTRSRSERAEDNSTSSETSVNKPLSDDALMTPVRIGVAAESGTTRPEGRWRVHQMAEDYMELVGNMMYPGTQLRPYGFDPERREYPLEGQSVLGYIKSPLRRPSVIERWSPYEISLFEGALLHHGKHFLVVSKIVGTKSTKDVIEFYYIWKKTNHYKKWKNQFVQNADLQDIESPVKPSPKI